ncbi:MAG: class I SAM-dependent methyltransferase [Treponemataceae bacterium]|nr:class I SAM-dependent methyltransferase [Treponemataceae bacterium]
MEKKQWFEKEDFWLNYGPIMFEDKRWAEAPDVAEAVMKIAGLKKGAKILDAGCGPGRISIELALLGLDVTGVDIIQPFLDAANESANDEGIRLNLVNADLRTFTPADCGLAQGEKFDAACNLYTSFGYCDTIEEDTQILKQIYDSIKEGGTFVMECSSRETAIKYFTEGEWFKRAGKIVLTEFSVEGVWEGLKSKWTLIDEESGEKIEHCFVQRLYSALELKQSLEKIGYSKVDVYGDFNYEKYDQNMRTMVIVAKK